MRGDGMPEVIAKVAVENAAFSFDDAFDYAIPQSLSDKVRPGVRVLVPFGNGSRRRQGLVFALREKTDSAKKLKSIAAVLDGEPLLNAELLRLAVFLKSHTFCTLFEAAKAMLPSGIGLHFVLSYLANPALMPEKAEASMSEEQRRIYRYLCEQGVYVRRDSLLHMFGLRADGGVLEQMVEKGWLLCNTDLHRRVGDATVKMARLTQAYRMGELRCKLTKKQNEVVSLLETAGCASVKEIQYFTGVTAAVVSALTAKGVVAQFQAETFRRPKTDVPRADASDICLTPEQTRAYEGLLCQMRQNAAATALLYGVTGSGKTQIYMKLLDECLKSGQGAIVMVPEISLTPQMLSLFYARYGETVAVFHSALSMGERLDEWKRVKRGEARIALGTRSAVFAPMENIGLFVLDEEQEHTYKSEMTPRYHARDVAQFRAAAHNALVLLASATPSLESYARAKNGQYALYTLTDRFGSACLPQVETVPVALGETDDALLSEPLRERLQATLDAGEQAILLLNRRGFNTFAACTACGKVRACPNCSISLTYHARNHRLMCHYCGYSEPFSDVCAACGEHAVRYSGSGTQRLEDTLSAAFPSARILRLDTDAASSRYSFENALKKFTNYEYDIMVGTQMVAKGLDFPNVTLVGVVSVDQMLFNDDYKSAERTFDLLTQVVGRAGRGEKPGHAVIQTAFPDNEIIRLACRQDFPAFYALEMQIRRAMVYPPYCDLCVFGFTGADEIQTRAAAQAFLDRLKALHKAEYQALPLIVLGPIAPRLSRAFGKFRFRVLLKSRNDSRFRTFAAALLKEYAKTPAARSVTLTADINPESIY